MNIIHKKYTFDSISFKYNSKKYNINSFATIYRILWLREHKPITYPFTFSRYTFKYNVIHRRDYSQVTRDKSMEILPVVVYTDAFSDKPSILKNTKNRVGIYRWVNKVNGNTYIGSSVNLGRRLRVYYDFSFLSTRLQKSKSRIYSAILKYGYSNFQLEILEYCAKENAISREQYYIDLLKPEYNLNSTAGSRLGSTHSEETRRKLSNLAKGRKATEETKKLLSLANKGMNNPNFGKTHSVETKALISLARLGKSFITESMKDKMSVNNGTVIRVLDLNTNEISVYTSITRAAKAMGVTQPPLSRRLKETQGPIIVKKRFQVEKVNENSEK